MIALDTNILLRYLVADDPGQAEAARELIQDRLSADEPGFVSMVVVAELYWALKTSYGRRADDIRDLIGRLLATSQLIFERAQMIEAALKSRHDGLADALIHEIAKANGCEQTWTFDRKFARLEGVELLC